MGHCADIMRRRTSFVLLFRAILIALACGAHSAYSQRHAIELQGQEGLHASVFASLSSDISVECWVKPTAQVQICHLIYFGDSNTQGVGLSVGTNLFLPGYATINIASRFEPATGNSTRLPLNIWTHLAFTKQGEHWVFYRNGVRIGRGVYKLDTVPS